MTWGNIAAISTGAGLAIIVAVFVVVLGAIWLVGNEVDRRREAAADQKFREWSERGLW